MNRNPNTFFGYPVAYSIQLEDKEKMGCRLAASKPLRDKGTSAFDASVCSFNSSSCYPMSFHLSSCSPLLRTPIHERDSFQYLT